MATGNVKTESTISREAEQKVQNQAEAYRKSGAYSTSKTDIQGQISKSPFNRAGLQTGVSSTKAPRSFFNAISDLQGKRISLNSNNGFGAKTVIAGEKIAGKAENALISNDDLGTQAAGAVIATGVMGVEAYRTTQKVLEAVPEVAKTAARGIVKLANGTYQIATTTGLAVVTVSQTATLLNSAQFSPISHAAINLLKSQAVATGLNQTVISQRIIHSVNGIQTGVKTGIRALKDTGSQIKTGYIVVKNTGIKIVRGVTNGTVTISLIKGTVDRYTRKIIHSSVRGIKTGAKTGFSAIKTGIIKGVTKGVPFVTFKAIPKGIKIGRGGILAGAGIMSASDDYAVQGVGHAINMVDIGVKTGIQGAKATRYTVKTAVKGAKTAYRGAAFIKSHGLRAAWSSARRKTFTKAIEAGKSIISALIGVVKALGAKIIVPILIVAAVALGFSGVIMAPISAVTAIFSSMFSTSDTHMDYDIREFLSNPTTGVPALSAAYRQNLANQMSASWKPAGSYHIVRFYSNTGTGDVVEPTLAGITSVFPTDEELINMLQPLFNAVLLMQYELEPTEAEAQALLENLFSRLFSVTTATSVEYCGQDLKTGEGAPTVHSCSSIHSFTNCPNVLTGTHGNYICSMCCYWYCDGHDYSCGDEDCGGHTSYCSGCKHACSGYSYCGGHDVISYTLNVDGIYGMVAEYFTDPIDELSNINPRTQDEEQRLQELKDYYEIFNEMMFASTSYNGGMTMADLSGVNFVDGTRVSNQAVIDLALSQVGQAGGQPYWSYFGFRSRVAWCACFVHWCMRHTPSATDSYPTTRNNAYCQTVADNFSSIGQWANRNYTDLVAGDTIFFDWEGDGHTDHIGLVIGTDGTMVYTVEGNSGDAVRIKSYPVGSGVIYGYGLMNY